jgi:ABC-type glycerol-3-phosphate transport system substrate-binding protein
VQILSDRRLGGKKRRKIVFLLGAWMAAILVLAGCGGDKESAGDDSEKLVLWTFADTHKQFYEEVAKKFKETHPDFQLEINLMEGQALVDKYTVIARSGGKGAPDLLDIEQGMFPNFIRGDIPFEPLNERMKADGLSEVMAPGRQALYTVDGREYGVEIAATVSALYYRKDVFDEAGIDVPSLKTWDEFTEAAKKLIDKDTFIFPANDTDFSNFEKLIRQEGGDIVTVDGKLGINTPEARIALQRIHDWKAAGIMDQVSPEGPAFWEAFSSGRYLAAFGPDWWANSLADNAPDLSGRWAAVPMPLGGPNSVNTTVQGGTGLMISKFSDKKDLAWEFIKLSHMTPEMAVVRFNIINLYPALLTAVNEPGLHAKGRYTDYYSGQDLGALYGSLLEQAPNQNQAWWRPLVRDAWEVYQFEYAEGKMTPEEFLAKVEEEAIKRIEAEESRQQ